MNKPREIEVTQAAALATLNKSEIESQITTAKAFPRELKQVLIDARDLATLDEQTAQDCIYAVPRAGKTVQGPSVRFAEILAANYGNCRVQARVIDKQHDVVVAQGIFHDLQKNAAIGYEVERKILDKNGNRFSDDMINTTARAACAIALREAILRGIPRAIWSPIYEATRVVAAGTQQTMPNRRARALAVLQKMGVTEEMVLAKLKRKSVDQITIEDLAILQTSARAIREDESTVEAEFGEPQQSAEDKKAVEDFFNEGDNKE